VLPFWLASLADRLIVLLVPIIVVLIPGLRIVPSLYAWRVKSRIYRWYGALIALERASMADTSPAERRALVRRLDTIEESVNGMKMPLAYAEQFYVLREHIGFVRARLSHVATHGHGDDTADADNSDDSDDNSNDKAERGTGEDTAQQGQDTAESGSGTPRPDSPRPE
jgi:hypothetical protein